MKFENIKATTPREVTKELGKLIAKKGNQRDAASEVGVSRSLLNQVVAGYANPGRQILEYFGLEARTVYVKKGGE